jgi:tRNA (pseudouridine54-N1)-methyltransferase
MREFVYFSSTARTSGNFDLENLMRAGRMDIACQVVIMSFFVSHHIRPNAKLHLVFNGPPDSPKHLEMFPGENMDSDDENKISISKKDVAGLIKKMLYKYKQGIKNEISKGYSIEKKSFPKVIEELHSEGKEIFILDKKGEDLREVEIPENCVFVLGDQDGLPGKEMKRLKKFAKKISVGPEMYFASQTLTIVNNELDRRGI